MAKHSIVINPTVDAAFTAVFFCEVALAFGALCLGVSDRTVGFNVAPVDAKFAALLLLLAIVGTFGVIAVVKRTSRVVGLALSPRVFPGNPLAKRRTMRKFEDQMWQLFMHVSMSAVEFYILAIEDGGEPTWWDDCRAVWTPHPHLGGQLNKPSIHVLYLLQMALWVDTCFQHRFVEERHKDYLLMYTHHLVTIALVGVSYYYNYLRVGVLVLYIHDVSDIPVDLLKLCNYCQLEGPKGLFLTELAFVTNLLTWTYYRLYLLSTTVLYTLVLLGAREMGTHPKLPT